MPSYGSRLRHRLLEVLFPYFHFGFRVTIWMRTHLWC